jgi:hypothetical protein
MRGLKRVRGVRGARKIRRVRSAVVRIVGSETGASASGINSSLARCLI